MALIRAGFVAVVAALLLAQCVDAEQRTWFIAEFWSNADCTGKKLTTQDAMEKIVKNPIVDVWTYLNTVPPCKGKIQVADHLKKYGNPTTFLNGDEQLCHLCKDESVRVITADAEVLAMSCTPQGMISALTAQQLTKARAMCRAPQCEIEEDGISLCNTLNIDISSSFRPYTPPSSGGLPWWAWLLIALGIEHTALMAWYYSTLGITWKFWKYYQRLYADIMARLF